MSTYTRYFVLNQQGDVIALTNANGAAVVTYTYDAWGRQLSSTTSGTNGAKLYSYNKLKYRGYYYDSDLGMYDLGSRFYDPVLGRFVNADDVDILGVQNNLYDKNLYAYCDNNPVTREDKSGRFWNVVIGAAVGAAAGLVGQIVSDGITSFFSGKLTISNWQTYTGAILGGAAGGAVLGATGNVNLSNAVTGTVTTGAGQTLEKLTIKGYDKSWGEIAANTVEMEL